MNDYIKEEEHDESAGEQAAPKLRETKQLTIVDWLHEDLLFKAGLPGNEPTRRRQTERRKYP